MRTVEFVLFLGELWIHSTISNFCEVEKQAMHLQMLQEDRSYLV